MNNWIILTGGLTKVLQQLFYIYSSENVSKGIHNPFYPVVQIITGNILEQLS